MLSDPLTHAQAALSSRRSLSRCRVLVQLDERGTMFPSELADACGMDCSRLRQVIFGDGVDFSKERSPWTLGQILEIQTPQGEMYAITKLGAAEAERLRGEPPWWVGRRR